MATLCKDVQVRIEESFWEPIDDWLQSTEEKCEEYDWWNPIGWFCWLVTIVVKIVRWVFRTIVTFVIRVVCEVINFALNVVAAVFNIILAIPIVHLVNYRRDLNCTFEEGSRTVRLKARTCL